MIAEFMSYDEEISSLKYDTSWYWLMTVVNKIYELGIDNEKVLNIKESISKNFTSAYNSVCDFIEWYNTKNK